MRKVYHSEEERREAQRAYDRKRQQTEHRRAYDRERYHKSHPSPIVQLPLIPLSRTCLTCGKDKDLATCFDLQKTGKYGYRGHCKECREKQRKALPARTQWVEIVSKVCPKCNPPTEKPIEEFASNKNHKDGHAGYCKECQRKWANSEEEKARQRDIRREMRRDPVKGQVLRDRLNNWRHDHPLSQQELTLRRNARKREATTGYVNFKDILERDGYYCYICEKPIDFNARKMSPESLTFDHVIPLQPRDGEPQGTHSEDNIRPAHKVCNARKANKPFAALTPFDRHGP